MRGRDFWVIFECLYNSKRWPFFTWLLVTFIVGVNVFKKLNQRQLCKEVWKRKSILEPEKKHDERVGESKMGQQENKFLSCYLPRRWGGMRRRLRFKEQRISSSRLLGRAFIKPWRSAVLARHIKNTHSHPALFTSAWQQCGETGCDERCTYVFIHSQQNIMKRTHFGFAAHLLFASISVSS